MIVFGVYPFLKKQKEAIDKYCFKECGKILIGAMGDDLMGFMPCKEENCSYEEKRKKYGKLKNGDIVYIRKLKEEK